MREHNAYNTNDPAQWLRLKQEEARLLLQTARSIRPDVHPDTLIEQVVDKIRHQLDVERIVFITRLGNEAELKACFGFDQPDPKQINEAIHLVTTQSVKPRLHPELHRLGGEYLIPVGHSPDPTGWFIIADFADSEMEIQNDLVFIETVGSMLMIGLQNILLYKQRLKQELLTQEMELAARIQKQSLPTNFYLDTRLDIHALNLAHQQVGGDFFDLIKLSDSELFICIADVAGKGVAAALLVANLQTTLRTLVQTGAGFRQMVDQLWHLVQHLTHGEQFITLFIAKIDLDKGGIEYVNAGHNPPLLIRSEGYSELMTGTIPIGIIPVPEMEVGHESFSAGDLLFLYTDGVVEQSNEKNDLLGYSPVAGLLQEIKDLPARNISHKVMDLVWEHAGKKPNDDDLSFMIIRFNG